MLKAIMNKPRPVLQLYSCNDDLRGSLRTEERYDRFCISPDGYLKDEDKREE
jgi:hypothetical protein